MFRASQRSSSGVLKTVTTTSGIGHNTGQLLSSDFAVNKCLLTVASSWILLLTLNHDARNHKSKISVGDLQILTVPTK
jgi:hypothetical protein